MKWIVDAQLPRRLARQLAMAGHDAIHTADLPAKNRTTDSGIIELAARDGRIVVTKDLDFVESFTVHARPKKLLLVATGNITNDDLAALMKTHLAQIESAFESASFIEMDRVTLTIHC